MAKSSKIDNNRLAMAQFLEPLEIVMYDDKAAQKYREIRNFLESKGKPIGALDTLIAAHAQSLNSILVTNNVREFKRVPKL